QHFDCARRLRRHPLDSEIGAAMRDRDVERRLDLAQIRVERPAEIGERAIVERSKRQLLGATGHYWTPTLAASRLRCPRRGSNSRRGVVTRAAGEGPRGAGIDGHCESAHEADFRCDDSRFRSKEAEALRRECWTPASVITPLV